jgi:lysophospholipase L1-like esterase
MTTGESVKRLAAGDTTFYQFDVQLGFWGIPNIQRMVTFEQRPDVPIPVSHNSDGNRDWDISCPLGNKTIVCFGGSHTWGLGVGQDERYTDQLAKRSGCRVLNMGHCSLGLDQVCLAMLNRAGKYGPRIFVVEQYPWAIHRVISPYVNGFVRPYFYLDANQDLKLRKVSPLAKFKVLRQTIGTYYAFRKEFREFISGIDLSSAYDPLTDPIFLYWKTRHYDHMYNLVDKILGVMRDYSHQNNIKLLFGLGAVRQQFNLRSPSTLVDYDLPRNRMIELLKKNNIAYVDMTQPMLSAHSKEGPVVFDDGHINPKGHDLFSTALYEDMLKRGWL